MERSTLSRVEVLAPLHELDHLSEQRRERLALTRQPVDGDLVAPHRDIRLELVLDQTEQVVTLAEQVHHVQFRRHNEPDLGRFRQFDTLCLSGRRARVLRST